MLYKCIYILINEEFVIWSRIQAYKGDTNVYGPLWTPTCICTIWTFFPYYSLSFSFIISSQKTLSSPTSSTIAWETFPIITASCITSPLLYSPVICKDNFPLVYMYKSSRYYAVFHINLGSIFPRSPTLKVLKLAPLQPSSFWLLLPATSWSYH